MPRGGRRTGTPGRGYANRTDLGGANRVTPQPVTPGPLPAQAVPGGPYGSSKAQLDAQRALPMASPTPPPPAAAPAGPPSPVAAPAGLPDGVPAPGTLPALDAPTERPGEHLMTGVGAGPGPGPEVLAPLVANPLTQALGVLAALGDQAGPQTRLLVTQLRQIIANEATP